MYDHSIFLDDVFIYIDKSGDYLVVEPYKLLEGNAPSYVLANFCQSLTSNQNARKQTKYINGEDYLKAYGLDTSLNFCRSVSDTMHVCRNRNGDGTLLTSIWDTKNGLVNLYFYHNYNSTVQFNLAEELAKGDRILNVISLFSLNSEFNRLANYRTPFNTPSLRVLLVILGGILTLFSLIFAVVSIRNRRDLNSYKIFMIATVLNLLLTFYFFVLATNISIYYFDATFKHYSSNFISTSSYIPFLLLLLIIPITFYNIRYIKINSKSIWVKSSLIFNNIIYLLLIIGFGYWGLFDIIN